jgi:DNA-binding response OmpR family regulator
LIVEDDAKLAGFLVRAIGEEGFTADRCTSGTDALVQAGAVAYEVMILDWMLPDLDGLEVCRSLRRAGVSVPILMLTARGELRERVLGLDAGADDYLVKPFEIDELLARLHALIRRATGHRRLEVGPLVIDRAGRKASLDGMALELKPRELGILVHLAQRANEVVPRTELIAQLWQGQIDPSSNVVEVQISRVRDKLGVHAWMIETLRGRGYRLRTQRPA